MPEEKVGKRVHPDSCLRYPPAADAGPRQPGTKHWENVAYEVKRKLCAYREERKGDFPNHTEFGAMIKAAYDVSGDCPAASETMQGNPQRTGTLHAVEHSWTIACHAPPRCKRAAAVPPVPQEAAPRLCLNCKEESWQHCRFHEPAHCHVECAQGSVPPWPTEQYLPEATAPDEAMRVAEKIVLHYVSPEGHWTFPSKENLAALIRQAGSERERQLEKFVARFIDMHEHGAGNEFWDELRAEASRLLGGESK